jgi:hypothetical protein
LGESTEPIKIGMVELHDILSKSITHFIEIKLTLTMNQELSSNSGYPDKKINPEQFDQVIEAILAGKYSWACVLMLRFVGYNPLHYIPYRTYNRLLKENSRSNNAKLQNNENLKIAKSVTEKIADSNLSPSSLSRKIKDLAYLEVGGKQKAEARSSHRDKKSA